MPNENQKPKHGALDNLRYILSSLVRGQPVLCALLALELAANVANSLLSTFTSKYVVELALGTAPRLQLALVCLALIVLERLTKYAGDELSDYRLYVGNDRFMQYMKRRLMRKAMTTDYANNESSEKNDLRRLAESGNEYTAFQTADTLLRFFMAFFTLLAYGSILSVLSPLMLPIIGIPAMVCDLIERRKTKWLLENASRWQKTDRELDYIRASASDFSAAKDIRVYGMEKWFGAGFARAFAKRLGFYREQDEFAFRHDLARFLIVQLSNLAAYAFVILLIVRGRIGAGDFVLYFGSIAAFGTSIRDVFDRFSGFEKLSGHIDHTRRYLELEDRTNRARGEALPTGACKIEVQNVVYRYGGAETPALDGISFTLHRGEKLALVGLNGAGKTTLVKLLCGLYDPSSGEIRIDGKPVSAYNRDEYFTLFSAVFQDINELPLTIAENIAGADAEKIDREKLAKCMQMAGIYDAVMRLPEKADTKLVRAVYENAAEFSGGQKQKFALARALYKDAPILLLDEPTAALDPIAEMEMYREYARFSSGKTSVFISHRLASTRFCDRILMIENGKIIEEGTHAVLLAKGGKYAELYALQSSYYSDKEGKTDA